MRTGLVLPYMLGLDVFRSNFFYNQKKKKKKKLGERMRNFILLIAFQILHVFLPDISVHCALIKYAYP
jgi:hypothetical protein